MRIPNKIKNFCWGACTESLPTLANLHRRKVVTSPLCSSCGTSRETVLHALWECNQVQACWGHSFMKVRQAQLHLGSFMDLVSAARQLKEDQELFTVIAWFFGADETNATSSNIACHLKRYGMRQNQF